LIACSLLLISSPQSPSIPLARAGARPT
jgi:hypothetical protein